MSDAQPAVETVQGVEIRRSPAPAQPSLPFLRPDGKFFVRASSLATPRPRGVFERPKHSGVWWINYYDSAGRRHREKVGRYEVALEAYYQRKREIREALFIAPAERRARVLFSELCAAALAAKQGRAAGSSLAADGYRAVKLNQEFGGARAAGIDAMAIDQFLQRLLAGGRCGPTVNRYRALLSSIFAYAVRTGQLRSNPVGRVPRFGEHDARVRFLDAGEETALRAVIRQSCPAREPELDLALNTGLRRNEQFGLRWEDVDLANQQLTVYGKGRGGQRRRFAPINAEARRALEQLHRQSIVRRRGDDGSAGGERALGHAFVIPEAKRRGQRDWRRWFEQAVRAAGIEDFTWHDLRHTFASRLVMAGVDLRTVQVLMGHQSIVQTMKYAHLSKDHELAAVEKLCPERRMKKPPRRAIGSGTKAAPRRVSAIGRVMQLAPAQRASGT